MSRGPTIEVAEGLREAASAGVELSRLQARLFWAEARSAKRHLIVAAVALGLGLMAVLYGVPLAVTGAAVLIAVSWNLSPATGVLIAGVILIVLGAGTSTAAYLLARKREWFPRSLRELRRNLEALWPREPRPLDAG